MRHLTKETIKIYLKHLLKYKWTLLIFLISSVAGSLLNVITPLYFKKFFDILTSSQAKDIIVQGLKSTIIFILFLEMLQWVFWRIAVFVLNFFQPRTMSDLNNTCFQYLHSHSFSFFHNNFVGSLVKKVNRFYKAFESICDRMLWELLPLIINIGFVIIVLFYKNFLLGLIMVIWLAIFLLINWLFVKFKLKYDIERSKAETEVSKLLADTITNNTNVKLFCGYKREVNAFKTVTQKVTRLWTFTWNLGATADAVRGLLMVAFEIGAFWVAIHLWQQGAFGVGDFVLLQSYVIIVFMKIWNFGRIVQHVYQDMADAIEMTEILAKPHEIVDLKSAKNLEVKKGKIEFSKVDFAYNPKRKILNNFNLSIKPRERIALVGPSGVGKSTVVRLLLRMHDVTGGNILIDDQKINRVTQESLWNNLSLVPQDPVLFHRTLAENIRYGNPEATEDELLNAASLAYCDEFIEQLPDKYESYVGERGIKLSGGERQRVAIARAILKNSPILILDEATSSLDSQSEKYIQKALLNLMEGKTVIAIAHRLSTIMNMDRIVVLDKNGIVEQGSHEQLTKKSGLYAHLWDLQAGGFIK